MFRAFNRSMAMTIELLERVLVSEVDNLHVRVDILAGLVEKVEERLAALEHRVDLLFYEVSEVKTILGVVTAQLARIEEGMTAPG